MTSGYKPYDNQTTSSHGYYSDCTGSRLYTLKTGTKGLDLWSGSNSPSSSIVSQVQNVFNYNIYNSKGDPIAVRRRKSKTPRSRYSSPLQDNAYSKLHSVSIDNLYDEANSCHVRYDYTVPLSSAGQSNQANSQPSPWSSNDDIALLGRLRSKLGAEFDLSVFLGEGKEALHTIGTVASRVYLSQKALRRGDLVSAVQILWKNYGSSARQRLLKKDAAGRWLEYTYAVKPLLNDVFNAAQHLAYMQNRPRTQKIRVTGKGSGARSVNPGGIAYSVNWDVRVSLLAKITHVNEFALIGLSNPLSVAWELLPYSFVADWFIPIGNYIQALDLARSLSGSFITSRKDVQYTYGSHYTGPSTKWEAYYLRQDIEFTRTVNGSLPTPSLPQVKPLSKAASWQHAANAVALLVNVFAGK